MASQFPYRLSQTQLDTFEKDGVLHLPKVIDDEWMTRGREACEHVPAIETVEGARAPEYFMKLRVWENHEVFRHFCYDESITGIAAQLTKSQKLNLLYDQMFNIAPGSGDRTVFHNDLPYWPIRGRQVVTIWVAFDKVVKENGAMEFFRGSHLWEKRYRPVSTNGPGTEFIPFESTDPYDTEPDWEAEREKHETLMYELEPGDALAFHPLVVHGSNANVSHDMQRRAYAMRFTGTEVTYYDGPVWNVYIMNPALKTGDPLDSTQYPTVYDARSA